jgi:hypothetical protein
VREKNCDFWKKIFFRQNKATRTNQAKPFKFLINCHELLRQFLKVPG